MALKSRGGKKKEVIPQKLKECDAGATFLKCVSEIMDGGMMNWSRHCAAVIPCLNEAATIGRLVTDVRGFVSTVLVVDDGSADGTGALAARAGAGVLRHAQPRGKGAAFQTGWRHAREHGFKWALTMDGDGQHSPADIPAFLDRAKKTSADLVVGNRMHAAEKMPRLRRFVNRWMSARISRLAEQPLPDSQCGFRLIDLGALAVVPLATAHFEIESEVLLMFARAGRKIEFVPIQVIYKSERSKIHPLRDAARWFRWWQKASLARRKLNAARLVCAPAK
jgi:glycosyltransferase involved in cell wall biosynthesis